MKLINKYIEKYGGLKVFLIMLLGLITLNIIIASITDINQKTFVIDGLRFKYDSVNSGTWYFRDENGVVLKAYNNDGRRNLTIFSGTLIFEYKDKVIRQVNDLSSMTAKTYVNEQLLYEKELLSISVSGSYPPEESNKIDEVFETKLIREVIAAVDYMSEVGIVNLILYSCFLIFLGTSQVAFPRGYWHLKYFLVVEGGEPSEFFIFMTQLTGLLVIAVGLLIPIFSTFY
ncbi:hypothetical protein [Cellulosilyticum sp. I15G10I2]|uniref:hypothetical protein n=1 Tax=Cellulosilyticum sp. I15G10I2 TaxID=1892843 RepID=UPI00085BBE68|nr:hypothetical protein [Cellulosilyticum sp. I15G10I2]